MSEETKEEIAMAECGACRAIVPLNSENCAECGVSFSGVSDEALGECGACGGLVPLDSTKCAHCGTIFVADDVVEVLRKWLSETGIPIPILFKKFDSNNDGRIDSSELKTGLLSLNLADLPPSQVERLIETIDADGDGLIDLSELHETITGEKLESETAVAATVPQGDDSDEEISEAMESTEDDSDSEVSDGDDVDEDDSEVDDGEGDDSTEDDNVSEEDESEEIEDENDSEDEIQDEDELDADEAIENEGETHDDVDEEEGELEDIDDVIDEIDADEYEAHSLLQLISDAMDERGDSPNKFFNTLDKDGNGLISVEEFTSTIEGLIDSAVSTKDIQSFLVNTDGDDDGSIDIIEFVEALESLDDVDEAIDDEARLSKKRDKPFPTDMQRKMMGKQWNDVIWPLIHLAFGLFIALWVINGLGGIGPLSVDGTGGNVELETAYGIGHLDWQEGDVYPCDPDVQVGECKNSLTPFSGDASSMPAGFYKDGLFFMALGAAGLIGSMIMHFVVVPGWRARSKAMKEVEDDTEEARSSTSEDAETDVDEDDESEEENVDESEVEDDEEYEEDDSEEEEDEDDAEGDDEIDIGSHIGLTFEDEEVFGVIVEFDDDEETVTIEEDGTGDLVTGYQEDMFVE
tara:strand:+ start:1085 stop:2986 length:1902 start_codon:yes stop_codon:yes gene_type:complete